MQTQTQIEKEKENGRKTFFYRNLPSVFISHCASTVFPGKIESNQYFLLTACPPSLPLISVHVSAGSSGIEPSGTANKKPCTSILWK